MEKVQVEALHGYSLYCQSAQNLRALRLTSAKLIGWPMKAIPKRSRKSPTWIESNVAHITSGDVEGEPIKADSSLCGERLRVPKPGLSNEPNRWLM